MQATQDQATAQVIEKCTVDRAYGFVGEEAIIDHPRLGRIYVADGYGGVDSPDGGAVRWRHGYVCKLHAADTLESLSQPWNEFFSVREAMQQGHDTTRPIMDIYGQALDTLAKSCGL